MEEETAAVSDTQLGKRTSESLTSSTTSDAGDLMPKKRFFRSRAHCNPLSHNDSFDYPRCPEDCDWSGLYPNIAEADRVVRILDIGMGFGGLTVKLAEILPNTLVLGMEIRAKVGRLSSPL